MGILFKSIELMSDLLRPFFRTRTDVGQTNLGQDKRRTDKRGTGQTEDRTNGGQDKRRTGQT